MKGAPLAAGAHILVRPTQQGLSSLIGADPVTGRAIRVGDKTWVDEQGRTRHPDYLGEKPDDVVLLSPVRDAGVETVAGD